MVKFNKSIHSLGGDDDISYTSTGNNNKYCNILKTDNNKHSKTTNHNNEIIIPNEYDVLCVKDKTFAKHIGNQIFHNVITKYAMSYAIASKHDKMKLTSFIINHIMKQQYQSRFLRLIHTNNNSEIEKDEVKSKQQQQSKSQKQQKMIQWEIITEKHARDKASHALRFASKQQMKNNKKWNISNGNKKYYNTNYYSTKCIKELIRHHEQALLQTDQINITTTSRIVDDAINTNHNTNLERANIQNQTKTDAVVINASNENKQNEDDDDDDNDNDSISVATTESFVELYHQQQEMLNKMKEKKQNQFQSQQQQQHSGINDDDNDIVAESHKQLQDPIMNDTSTSYQCCMVDESCKMMKQRKQLQKKLISIHVNNKKMIQNYHRSNQSEYSISMRGSCSGRSGSMKQLDENLASSTHDHIIQISSSLSSSSIQSNNMNCLSKYSSSRRFTNSIGDDIVRLLDMSIMTLESI